MIENTVNVAQAAATVSVIARTTRAEIERIFSIVRPRSGRKSAPPSHQKRKKLIPPNHSPENDEFLAGREYVPGACGTCPELHRPQFHIGPIGVWVQHGPK